MQSTRKFIFLAIGEALVVAVYVLAVITDLDVSSFSAVLRILAVAGAAAVAVTLYQAWSNKLTAASLAAMLAGLLGGAALASTAVSAKGDAVFASDPVATFGTCALIAAVILGQLALAQDGKRNS